MSKAKDTESRLRFSDNYTCDYENQIKAFATT